ncbi:hypothetical protein HPB51_022902 [Rhipicephalus microplus]|uniref:SGNH hydrolase-type esterase domain-containing protein n=1 Tax=Rhipicephalus microplus TaxID=6941 RepID=A0A9J6EJ71_RHIMP|nr:hypothetical protein HPB51_022902 [Rhipicephalus microplus]
MNFTASQVNEDNTPSHEGSWNTVSANRKPASTARPRSELITVGIQLPPGTLTPKLPLYDLLSTITAAANLSPKTSAEVTLQAKPAQSLVFLKTHSPLTAHLLLSLTSLELNGCCFAFRKQLTWRFPIHGASTGIVGDSQLKYLHQHFNPASPHSPAFICQPGACIGDIGELLDFVPKGTSNLILNIGTNDLANTDAPTAFNLYVALFDRIRYERPDIPMVFATLVLPRAPNQRLRRHNWRAVRRFNFEAREFNLRLLSLCHEREGVFYVNHRIDALPPWTVLAADGLHPSFAGMSLLAWNIYNLLLDLRRPYINNWLEHAPQPEAGAYELRETPSYSQALRRDSSDATCRGGKEKNMNPAAPETLAARSPGQHTPSRPPSPSAQLPSRLPRLSSTPTTHTPETVTKGNPGQQQRPAVPKSTATSGQSKPPARKNQQPTSSTKAATTSSQQQASTGQLVTGGTTGWSSNPNQVRPPGTLRPYSPRLCKVTYWLCEWANSVRFR